MMAVVSRLRAAPSQQPPRPSGGARGGRLVPNAGTGGAAGGGSGHGPAPGGFGGGGGGDTDTSAAAAASGRRRRRRRPRRRGGFGGCGPAYYGSGGGAGLGGGIFSNGGALTLTNDTFTANSAIGGSGGTGAATGQGLGGAVFARNGSLNATFDTFSGNTAAQGGTDLYVLGDKRSGGSGNGVTAALINDILGQNGTGPSDFMSSTHMVEQRPCTPPTTISSPITPAPGA